MRFAASVARCRRPSSNLMDMAASAGQPDAKRGALGVETMVWRGYLDLPAELEGKLPRILTELIVAFAAMGLAVGLRLALDKIVPGVVPFALTFPMIAAATLMAGTRAGVITIVGCQTLIWYAVLPPQRSFAIESPALVVSLILVTVSQAVMLLAIGSYRGIVGRLEAESRQRIDDLSLALREIDHRTKNNFQLAVGLLEIQGRNAGDPALRSALNRAASRLQAIGSAYRNLAISSADLTAIRLHDYLEDMCDRLREGLLSPAIVLKLAIDPVTVPHDMAIRIGLIVNELVTNAAKHAFPDGIGVISITLEDGGNFMTLTVDDDGKGFDPAQVASGLGTRLIAMLVRQLGAKAAPRTGNAATHIFTIPYDRSA
jgi:two-component sensor histidine kinase